MREVILYHGMASTCSKKVRLSLYEKGVDFESRLLDLQKFEQHEPQYLAINPNGVVPALVHDGQPIVESSIIAEYVDEAFDGPPLSPFDPIDRAQMRLWIRYSDEKAYTAVVAPTWQYMRNRVTEGLGHEEIKDTLAKIPTNERRERWLKMSEGGYTVAEIDLAILKMTECLDKLEVQLEKTKWLAGANFSLADMALLPFAARIRNLKPELLAGGSHSAVADWLARAASRPSYKRAMEFTEDPRASYLPNI